MAFNPTLSRRAVLGLLGAGSATASGWALATLAKSIDSPADTVLRASMLAHPLQSSAPTQGMMSFSSDGPPPVLRLQQNKPFIADVINDLDEPTTVHWHGLRINNNQDGVPYLTQLPIMPGEVGRYHFTPPDAGTYWYHPHCNTLEQMGHGMTGVLVVEDEKNAGFDDDLILNLRDFRLGDDGQFLPLSTPRKAARGGTHGNFMTINWLHQPVYNLPAGALIRLRLAITDLTRTYKLELSGATSQLIAMDGNPVPTNYNPNQIIAGAGQRVDIALQVPGKEGQVTKLTTKIGQRTITLAQFKAIGIDAKRSLQELKPLTPNPIAIPDLSQAKTIPFTFGWAPGDQPANSICGTLGNNFWAINRQSWPGDQPKAGAPIAVLKKDQSYIFRLRNETRYNHPIHLHGMTFQLLRSNKRDIAPLFTDTALLLNGETMDVALVADNLGDWVFHCHVIEHQKTGLAAYVRVE